MCEPVAYGMSMVHMMMIRLTYEVKTFARDVRDLEDRAKSAGVVRG